MSRPYRFEADLDERYDTLTEEIYRVQEMEAQLKGAIETAAQMERSRAAFDGLAGLLQTVLCDITQDREAMQKSADEMWEEMSLRGEV